MRGSVPRRPKEFDVVDFRKPLSIHCSPSAPGEICELLDVLQLKCLPVLFYQKKPVSTPRYIAEDWARARNTDLQAFCLAKAGDVFHRDRAIAVKSRAHDARARIDRMLALTNSPHMRKCGNKSNGAVPAHAEITNVVEKDHPSRAAWVMRFAEQSPHQHVRPARFRNDSRAEPVIVLAEDLHTLRHGTRAKVRSAFNDDSRWLSSCVRINYSDPLHFFYARFGILGRLAMPSWITFKMRSRSWPCNCSRGGRTHSLPRPHSCTASLMYCTNFV